MKSWRGCLKLSAREILSKTARNCRHTTKGEAGWTAAAAGRVGPTRFNLDGVVCSVASSVEGQRRNFVSVPKSKDWASRSRAAVNNPLLMSHPSSATAVVSPRTKNEALLAAAEEADRLLLLNSTVSANTTSSSPNTAIQDERPDKHPAFHGAEYKDHQDILDAANALLLVSNDPVLQNFIATSSSRRHSQETSPGNELVGKQIATIHRAFLSLTTKCLEHCEGSGDPALFHAALELARHAHDHLQLPFHLPLYQRLMEIAPSSTNNSSETVLEIVSFCQTLSPEAVRSSALFGPVLKAMIAQGKLNDAVLLLEAMKFRLDVAHWDRQTVSDIYIQLHRAMKNSFLTTGRRDFPVEPCLIIVQFLEEGILSVQMEKLKGENSDLMAMYKSFCEALDNRDAEAMARLMDEFAAMEHGDNVDEEEYDSDDEVRFAGLDHDPLDQVVHSILTKRVLTPAARQQFAEMISKAKSPRMIPKSIEIVPASDSGSNSSGQTKGGGMKVIVSVASSRLPSPRRSSSSLSPPAWYGDPHRFPDVIAQVMRLNHGRRLEFTPAYEDYLWKRSAESDNEYDDEYDDDDDDDDSDDDFV